LEEYQQNLKNKLEKLSEMEGMLGIFAFENREKIYSKHISEKICKNTGSLIDELRPGMDSVISELGLSMRESVIQFSGNLKIISLNKKDYDHNYQLFFLTSRYVDVISIRRYIE